MPMLWWPSDDVVNAVIDGEGPWPSLSPLSNGTFVPFDVDKYDGLAVVVGHGRNRKGREVLGSDEFQLNDVGTWEHLTGGGSGWSAGQRWDLREARDALHFRMGGSSGRVAVRCPTRVLICGVPLWTSGHDSRSRPSAWDQNR